MTGHAAEQRACPEICQLVNTMRASVPDRRHDTAIWKFTAVQHFACFPTTTAQPWRVTSTLPRSTDSEAVELPITGFNIAI